MLATAPYPPAPVRGEAEDAARDHAQCGSLNAQAVCRTRHPNVVLGIRDNSSAAVLEADIKASCPDALTLRYTGNAVAVAAAHVPRGRYVIALVHCTGNAVPCPPAQARAMHWITLYKVAPDSYYQCWTASYDPISDTALAAASTNGEHLVVWFPSAPTPSEDGMFLATAGIRPATIGQDPNGQGAVYLIEGTPEQPGMFKRWINGVDAAAMPDYTSRYGTVIPNYDPFMLDRIIRLAPIDLTAPTLVEEGAPPIASSPSLFTAEDAAALMLLPGIAASIKAIEANLNASRPPA